jgi:diguanylate cyclase (GGDEF)-like protein
MMLDLDGFKQVNDRYGHGVGDLLLIEVAARLQSAVRGGDLVARLGGDEFAFLLVADGIDHVVACVAERVLRSLAQPCMIHGLEVRPGGSLGIAFFPRDASDPAELLALADRALYDVKARGGGGWAVCGCSAPAMAAEG